MKLIINLLVIVCIWYFGFVLFSGGMLNPIEWPIESRKYFVGLLTACVLAYLVLSAEAPKD